jgi:predicted dehydrogenase
MLTCDPDVSLAAVYARRSSAATGLADTYGATAVRSLDDLFGECDAIAFTVPPDVQAQLAPLAAAAGKHLLLEKPLGFTVEQATAIASAVDDAGIVSQIVLTNRYTAAVAGFLAALASTRVRAMLAEIISGGALPGAPFATPWRQRDNALLDVGPHVLDLLEAAAGPAVAVFGRVADGCVAVTLEHAGGAISQAMLSITMADARGSLRSTALTDRGAVVLSDPSIQPLAEVHRAIVGSFRSAVAAGRSDARFDVHRGVGLQRLLDAVQRSIDAGETVKLP